MEDLIFIYDDERYLIEGTIEDFRSLEWNSEDDKKHYEIKDGCLYFRGKYIAGQKQDT